MTLNGRQNINTETAGLWLVTLAILTKWKYIDRKTQNKRKGKSREWK
jgi:hypothetical protein